MASHALLIEVRLLGGRYHGVGDWPPSPFRLFQALVAGAYGGRWAAEPTAPKDTAFRWLERLAPPIIAAPPSHPLRPVQLYVPNNDLDAKGNDPRNVAEIRAAKLVQARLLTGDAAILYAWPYESGPEADAQADTLCLLAERLHRLGQGIDPAFARAETLPWSEAEDRLASHGGANARPSGRALGDRTAPRCPMPGSFDSLRARHEALTQRFEIVGTGKRKKTLFRQPPKPDFRSVAYDRPPFRRLYDLAPPVADAARCFRPWALARAVDLVVAVRDGLAARLTMAQPERAAEIERLVIGRGAAAADLPLRPRLIPLPSIGMAHTDPAIRRLVLEVPPDCPIPAADLAQALSGLDLNPPPDPETGELVDAGRPLLAEAGESGMAAHYGIALPGQPRRPAPALTWHSVTPVALPTARPRGRLDGGGRQAAEAEAVRAVRTALRQAGVREPAVEIAVRREPWTGKGARADAFAPTSAQGERFPAARLWHVRIVFARPLAGPLLLGDGRFLGLGLMAPEDRPPADLLLFPLAAGSRPPLADRDALLAAARRALMSLAANRDGTVPTLFSGHADGPGPARPGDHRHVYLAALDRDGDGHLDHLAVIAPWRVDRTWRPNRFDRVLFDRVVRQLNTVRAGRLGVLCLEAPEAPTDTDLFGRSRVWRSLTPYRPTRYPKRGEDPAVIVAADVQAECRRRGLPAPAVTVETCAPGPRGGLTATLALDFPTPVAGPLLLGRTAHAGGGMFAVAEPPD